MEPTASTPYPPLTPSSAAAELNVPLSQRLLPDLSAAVPKRHVSKAEAEARGWSWYFDATTGACRYGHIAARRTSNDKICSDCDRVKEGKEPIYGKSRVQKFYEKPRRQSKDPSAPVVMAAPIAPAQIEPSKKEQDFLAALDSIRSFDAAAEQTGFNRGLIEARASSNEVFRKALTDLCERRGIAWTRAPDAETFKWSPEIEKQFTRRWVDCGLRAQTLQELDISASEYHAHIAASPSFASLIAAAESLALHTLRDRALKEASTGNDRLLKILEVEKPEEISTWSVERINAEITTLLQSFDAQGLLVGDFGPRYYQHVKTGERIDLREYERVQSDDSNLDLVSSL